ncbi:MAG: TSUP family transporter [Polynucleobacter sp.]|jgi:hypothetical protein|nr:TSUP family transporter [Polynucleobacter sp.]
MLEFSEWIWIFLLFAAFIAGTVDAVAGGGGLIQVPALFAAYPEAHPANLLAINKVSGVGGTLNAARRYLHHVDLPWKIVAPAIVAGFFGSLLGAGALSHIPDGPIRKALPFVLLALLIYTWFQPNLGLEHRESNALNRNERAKAILLGAGLGFYDGIFGPGTGSFFLFIFVRVFHFDFLHASAATKLVNAATNVASVLLFAGLGLVRWELGLAMMVANIAGSQLGSRLAIKRGSAFVKKAFLLVVSCLIIKSAYDAFFNI